MGWAVVMMGCYNVITVVNESWKRCVTDRRCRACRCPVRGGLQCASPSLLLWEAVDTLVSSNRLIEPCAEGRKARALPGLAPLWRKRSFTVTL